MGFEGIYLKLLFVGFKQHCVIMYVWKIIGLKKIKFQTDSYNSLFAFVRHKI